MGQVCSGAGVSKHVCVPRDPADKELDPLEMKETKIEDFDTFFESASTPLNELVEIHNALAQSEENLKSAAAAMQGEAQVRITFDGSRAALELWKFDENEEEVVITGGELDDKLAFSVGLREAFDATQQAINDLNAAWSSPPSAPLVQVEPKRGRLLVTKRGALDVLVRDVNVAAFSLRKHLMLQAHVTSLREAAVQLFSELAKVEDLSELNVAQDEETGKVVLMNGNDELDLRRMDKLSAPALQLRDAFIELMENLQTAATSVPELAEASSVFAQEAQSFPARVPEAVSGSGLGLTEIPKAAAATASNAKALTSGPKIAKATMVMVQYSIRELAQAVTMPRGG